MKVQVTTSTATTTHKPTYTRKRTSKGIPLLSIPMMTDTRWNELAQRQSEVKTA